MYMVGTRDKPGACVKVSRLTGGRAACWRGAKDQLSIELVAMPCPLACWLCTAVRLPHLPVTARPHPISALQACDACVEIFTAAEKPHKGA